MSDIAFPLNPASVQDGQISVDLFVKEPTRLSTYIADNVEGSLLAPLLFSSSAAQGGAIMFEQVAAGAREGELNPGVIAPGAEFPVLDTIRTKPEVVPVVKTGGKYFITDEAMKRNDPSLLQRQAVQVANKMARDIDNRAFAVVKDTVDNFDGALSFQSNGWAAAASTKKAEATATSGEGQIVSDLEHAKLLIEETRLGYNPDTLVLGAKDAMNLRLTLGIQNWQAVLQTIGLNLVVSTSDKIDEGEGFLMQAGATGVMGVEDPISTETWREPATQTQYFSTWATMAFGITDPLSVVHLKDLNK